jgi:hypothetical protein
MTVAAALPLAPPRSLARTLLTGGALVALCDGTDAVLFFGALGYSPPRVFQSVAGGLLGREAALAGGAPTAALGLLLHFVVATGVFTNYFLVARRWQLLARHPLLCGPLYGLIVYQVMERVVAPLSALHRHFSPTLPVLLNGVIGHALLVGLPAALFTARALRQGGPRFPPFGPRLD